MADLGFHEGGVHKVGAPVKNFANHAHFRHHYIAITVDTKNKGMAINSYNNTSSL